MAASGTPKGIKSAPELTTGVIYQTGPIPPLDQRTKTELCSLYVHTSGGRHVEGVCGRGGGTSVDCAVCRNDRGLGAIAPPALRSPRRSNRRSWGKAGRRTAIAPSAWTQGAPRLNIGERVGL